MAILPAGSVFNRLTVVSYSGIDADRGLLWLCQCSCGAMTTVSGKNLRKGSVKSCGCLRIDAATKRLTTHGKSKATGYKSWLGMTQRCGNPKSPRWSDYGGRGITVCERWDDFANFLEDMGECPLGHSIEREDNDAGYSPENCRWADRKTQARNRRSTKFVTVCGVSRPIVAVCEEYKLDYKSVWERQRQVGVGSLTEALFDVMDKALASRGSVCV